MVPRLLDECLSWRTPHQRQHGGAWTLGQGLTVSGPGWHSIVRRAFTAVAETPGAEVANVRQKCGLLEVRMEAPTPEQRMYLSALGAELTDASRSRCQACGDAVPRVEPGDAVWRNLCGDCRALLTTFAGPRAELRLWEVRAGRSWPRSEC